MKKLLCRKVVQALLLKRLLTVQSAKGEGRLCQCIGGSSSTSRSQSPGRCGCRTQPRKAVTHGSGSCQLFTRLLRLADFSVDDMSRALCGDKPLT